MKPIATIDFETEAIADRPHYPPKSVGVAIQLPGRKQRYYAYGHPTENNCDWIDAKRALKEASKYRLLGWNRKFDHDILETEFGIRAPHGFEDAYLLAFLSDPYAPNHSLKPFAQARLGIKPDERDAVRDWLVQFVPEAKRKRRNWGAYISKAPGKLVGEYSIGDIDRTKKLFDHLYPEIVKRGMRAAYERELELLPILLTNEREGVRVDARRLARDLFAAEADLKATDRWLCRALNYKDLNIDSNEDLADALEYAGMVKHWIATPTGERSTAKENLLEVIENKEVAHVLDYRGRLAYVLASFMRRWLDQANATGGHIHTQWNQVRGRDDRGGGFGARTGRLSSSPNFQNIPKDPMPLAILRTLNAVNTLPLPYTLLRVLKLRDRKGNPQLPNMRDYVIPDASDAVLLDADYSQQEVRILAHFEQGRLLDEYNKTPGMDAHKRVGEMIHAATGLQLKRRDIKIVTFAVLYGAGLARLAAQLGCDEDEARKLKAAYYATFPDIRALDSRLKHEGHNNHPIRTWGDREYYVEPSSGGRDYAYKLLNFLIQGSAADCTKLAIIRYTQHPKRRGRLLLSVHDELLVSVPKQLLKEETKILVEAMESVEFSLPMLAEATYGKTWATCK